MKWASPDGRFQIFAIQRAFMKFDIGVARCAEAVHRFLVHTFNQQKFNLVFSSDTLAISPSCFVFN